MTASAPPLCVDLDGTLIEGDTLRISAIALLRRRPWAAVGMAAALVRGRAAFKEFVAERFVPEPTMLRWRPSVVEFVTEQHVAGRRILLVTAAHRRVADMVARHLPIFVAVFATEGGRNLKGEAKLQALREAGVHDFDFVSDSVDDLPCLRAARNVWLVAPSLTLKEAAGVKERIVGVFCHT